MVELLILSLRDSPAAAETHFNLMDPRSHSFITTRVPDQRGGEEQRASPSTATDQQISYCLAFYFVFLADVVFVYLFTTFKLQ